MISRPALTDLTRLFATLVVGFNFALIFLVLAGIIAGNQHVIDGPAQIGVLIVSAVGWYIVERRNSN